jgi:hypothetical protein
MLLRTYTKEEVNTIVYTEVNKVKDELGSKINELEKTILNIKNSFEDYIKKQEEIKSWKKINDKNAFLIEALKDGNLDKIKWLGENDYIPKDGWGNSLNKTSVFDYVPNGNLEIMKYLKDIGCSFSDNTFSSVASTGNLKIMKWLKENGCFFGDRTFHSAASNGNLENMKWLKENGCSFSFGTFSMAVSYGDLETLNWLKENDCHFEQEAFSNAKLRGNLEIMKWLEENRSFLKSYSTVSAAGF